jgi:cytochrome c5
MKPIRLLSLAAVALATACAQSPTDARSAVVPRHDGTNYGGSGNVVDGGSVSAGHYVGVAGLPRVTGRRAPFAPRFDDAGVIPPDTTHRGTNYGGSGN